MHGEVGGCEGLGVIWAVAIWICKLTCIHITMSNYCIEVELTAFCGKLLQNDSCRFINIFQVNQFMCYMLSITIHYMPCMKYDAKFTKFSCFLCGHNFITDYRIVGISIIKSSLYCLIMWKNTLCPLTHWSSITKTWNMFLKMYLKKFEISLETWEQLTKERVSWSSLMRIKQADST